MQADHSNSRPDPLSPHPDGEKSASEQGRKQGRRKHQPIKQYSVEAGAKEQNVLLAIFGEHALTDAYQLASDCKAGRPIMKELEALCVEFPETAQEWRNQIDDLVRRVGRFIIESDVRRLREFLNASIALEDQKGKIADPVRFYLIDQYEQLSVTFRRPPTSAELRAAVGKRRPAVISMDESQFRRTCKKLSLQCTDEKKWNKLCRIHRQLASKAGGPPSVDVLMATAHRDKLPWVELAREEFVELCLANDLIVRVR